MKRQTKIILLIIVLLVSGFLFLFIKNKIVTPLDYPIILSDKEEIIEVYYVHWACDCANWIETNHWIANPDYETNENDCIYIESGDIKLQEIEDQFVSDYFQKKLRLTGRFYKNNGISSTFAAENEKPEYARVFRYSKIEIIK